LSGSPEKKLKIMGRNTIGDCFPRRLRKSQGKGGRKANGGNGKITHGVGSETKHIGNVRPRIKGRGETRVRHYKTVCTTVRGEPREGSTGCGIL